MQIIFVVSALLVFLKCIDRLRQINWHQAKPTHVMTYLAFTLWALWLIYESAEITSHSGHLLGLVGALAWLFNSRESWLDGPPAHVMKEAK